MQVNASHTTENTNWKPSIWRGNNRKLTAYINATALRFNGGGVEMAGAFRIT